MRVTQEERNNIEEYRHSHAVGVYNHKPTSPAGKIEHWRKERESENPELTKTQMARECDVCPNTYAGMTKRNVVGQHYYKVLLRASVILDISLDYILNEDAKYIHKIPGEKEIVDQLMAANPILQAALVMIWAQKGVDAVRRVLGG